MRNSNSALLGGSVSGIFFRCDIFFSDFFDKMLCILFCVVDK